MAAAAEETVMAGMEEEKDEEGKIKKEGVVLESENKFFWEGKKGDPKLLGEEVE